MARASRYPDIGPDAPLRTLADAVLRCLWDAMLKESSDALSGEDIDAVHDMRVAIRRFRSALRTFGDCYRPKRLKRLRRRTRRLGRTLGVVRDTDVHLDVVRAALERAPMEERAGIAFIIERIGEQRGRALVEFASLCENFDPAALPRMIDHG